MKLPIKEPVFIEKKKKTVKGKSQESGSFGVFEKIKKKIGLLWQNPNAKSVFIITFFLLFSRLLGFVRTLLIYQKMDKISSDLFIAATKIPEMITLVLIMGTITSSVLPVASRVKERMGEKKMVDYINLVQASLVGLVILISLWLFVFTEPMLNITTSTETWDSFADNNLIKDYVAVARILLLGPIFLGVRAFFGVFLNIKKRFLVYSWAGTIYNLGAVVGLIIGSSNDYFSLATWTMIGACVSVLFFWFESRKIGFYHRSLFKLKELYQVFKTDFWITVKTFLPRIFLLNGLFISSLLMNMISRSTGQITAYDIGLAIQGIFFALIVSVGTVLFPDLARLWNTQDPHSKTFWNKLFYYTKSVALLSLIGGVITFFAAPLVLWFFEIFGKGQDTADYIVYLARVATLSLVFQSVNLILMKYFYVRERVWQPVIISVSAAVGQIILTFWMVNADYNAGLATGMGLLVNSIIAFFVAYYLIRQDYHSERLTTKA